MKKASGYEKSCATCQHRTTLMQPLHYRCVGCLKDGQCTKWTEKQDKSK